MAWSPWIFRAALLAAYLLPLFPLMLAAPVSAEYFRYVDEAGRVHYVDELFKVPDAYMHRVDRYREPSDFMSPDERRARERENEERERRNRDAEEAFRRRMRKEEERRDRELEARRSGSRETPVDIIGNKVLVPVTIHSRGRSKKLKLVLDTGASIIALHRPAVESLHFGKIKTAKARVAGGGIIDTQEVVLERIQVGPHTKTGLTAGILEFPGNGGRHQGLLGMNFLRDLHYRVDFKRRVLVWQD